MDLSRLLDTESALSRRDFLQRTAYAAGAAGAAASLPASALIAEAAKAQRAPLPSPRNMPIDHFVIVMMENRSYDHYFGWLTHLSDGVQQQTFTDPSGNPVQTRHASTLEAQWQGCGHPDPGHGWESGRAQLNGGFLADGSGNDEFALTYYDEGDLGFIHPAGREFTVYDRYFCSLLGPTWPNRYYKWSAQSGGKKNNDPPLATAGNQWETIFDRALANNPLNIAGPGAITANYYNSDLPFSAVWGVRGVTWTRPIAQYYADCAAGTLPSISIVDPPFRDGGGGDGLSADEHPHGDVRLGQAWMSDVAHAFMESPCYRRGALFVIYDEWGGFFDHVRPPSVADDRASSDLNEDFGQMGFRTPAVAISPYARNDGCVEARVSHAQLGHESILKLITYRFGLGDLVTRDAQATNIGESFDWDATDLEPPDLPDPDTVASAPCALGGDTNRDLPRSCWPSTSATSRTSRTWPSATGSRSGTASRSRSSASPTRSRRPRRPATTARPHRPRRPCSRPASGLRPRSAAGRRSARRSAVDRSADRAPASPDRPGTLYGCTTRTAPILAIFIPRFPTGGH